MHVCMQAFSHVRTGAYAYTFVCLYVCACAYTGIDSDVFMYVHICIHTQVGMYFCM